MHSADAAAHSAHALLHMEHGVIRQIHNLLNPRPALPAGTVAVAQGDTRVPVRPPHPILSSAQLRLNCVLASRTPHNQEPGTRARVSSLMRDDDVKSGSALFFALRHNRSDATVCDLIDMNPLALTMIDTDNDTPLLVALKNMRSFRVVQHMVLANKDVIMYMKSSPALYPLVFAISHQSDPRIVAILIDENGDVLRHRDSSNKYPVCQAMLEGYSLDVLKLLLYPGCPDIYDRPPESVGLRLPLHMAVKSRKSFEVVKFLVELNKAALLMTDRHGMTALHLAVTCRPVQDLDVQLIQFLAQQAPATLTMLSEDGKSPFRLAVSLYYKSFKCRHKFDEVAAILLALRDEHETVLIHPANNGDIPLMRMCAHGFMLHPAVFRVLIGTKHATTTMTHPVSQETALHCCVTTYLQNRPYIVECAQLLCVDDIVFTMRDHQGRTPLHTCMCCSTNTALVKALTRIAPPRALEMADNDGNLPLHIAVAQKADDEAIACFMGNRAVTSVHRNKQNNRAIDIAMRETNMSMARMSLFMCPGMDMMTPGWKGRTMLHNALKYGAQPAVVSYLIQAQPGMLGVKNTDAEIPLMLAIAERTLVHSAWQPRWSNKFIRKLAMQTHATNPHFIPSCRSVFREQTATCRAHYEGHSVLYVALSVSRPLSIIRFIVEADVAVLTTVDRAREYSQIASEHYEEDFANGDGSYRVTKLFLFHSALWYAADIKILMYLAEKHPSDDLFEEKDIFQNTALHMAIRQQKRGEMIKKGALKSWLSETPLPATTVHYLIRAGEMALLIPDEHGNTPLHLAIVVGSNTEIMQHLVESCTPPACIYQNCVKLYEMPCESAFLMQNKELRTPLHLAMKHDESTVPLQFIMDRCPQAMLIKDKDGCTPMHLMMSRCPTHINPDTILQLLQTLPEVMFTQDNLGRTPLHILLISMHMYRYQYSYHMSDEWQRDITQHLTGITAGLLTTEECTRLMKLVNSADQSPLQYYLQKFVSGQGRFSCAVAGRVLKQASRHFMHCVKIY